MQQKTKTKTKQNKSTNKKTNQIHLVYQNITTTKWPKMAENHAISGYYDTQNLRLYLVRYHNIDKLPSPGVLALV